MEDSAIMRMTKERYGRNKKINAVFIDPQEDKPEVKPFCGICRVYAVYIKNNGYECPNCGQEFRAESETPGEIGNRYRSEPMIATRGKKRQNRSDFPKGAHIIEDKQINSDGEEKQLIVEGKDV